jgi:hypothetical protein
LSDAKVDPRQQAQDEVDNEVFEEDKLLYKKKFKNLKAAEVVVENIKREIEDLDAKIGERK